MSRWGNDKQGPTQASQSELRLETLLRELAFRKVLETPFPEVAVRLVPSSQDSSVGRYIPYSNNGEHEPAPSMSFDLTRIRE
jgi:hypothetical protein